MLPIIFDSYQSPFDDIFDIMLEPRQQNLYVLMANFKPKPQKQRCLRRENCCKLRNTHCEGIVANKDDFTVKMDVQGFRPEEITVKFVDGNVLSIEAKHEEKEDQHGFVFRHIVRKYTIPEGYDINNITSKLSIDAQLAITAPKVQKESPVEKLIQIQQTGKLSEEREAKQKAKENSMQIDQNRSEVN